MAPTREQTDRELGNGCHQTETEIRCAHWNQTDTGSSGSARGRLAAGGVINTKDRDSPALEVRAGMPAMGRISRDAAGLSSTNRNRVKVARTSVENGPRSLCSETEAEIQPLLL